MPSVGNRRSTPEQIHTLKARREAAKDEAKRLKLTQSLSELSTQQAALAQDQQHYREALTSITLGLHPFTLDRAEPQTGSDLVTAIEPPLTQLRRLATTYGQQQSVLAIETFQHQLPDLVRGLHAWWQWATQALSTQTSNIDLLSLDAHLPLTLGLLAPASR